MVLKEGRLLSLCVCISVPLSLMVLEEVEVYLLCVLLVCS